MSALAAPTVVKGEVGTGCVVNRGTGFTVAKTGTGKCAITFTTAFTKAPIVNATAIADVSGFFARLYDIPTTTQAFVKITNDANGATDATFDFVALDVDADLAGGSGGTGTQGPKGDKGDPGDSAYQVWLKAGHTGTEADFLASLKGPKGDTGPAGAGGDGTGSVDTSAVVSAIATSRDFAHADAWWAIGLVCALFFGYLLYRAVTPRA